MPGGVDAMLLLLAASRPSWMLIYVASATIGSTAGCVGLYQLSKRAGHRALNRFSESKQKRVKDLIDRYDVLSVLVASVLPPPFPFKLFVVSAGVFRLNIWRFTIAIAVGRTFRYLLEGYLAARYGDRAKEILAQYYPAIGIGVAVLIIVFFVGKNLWRRNNRTEQVSGVES
jgi:membrane protein YqaA with SNARE-associated domain